MSAIDEIAAERRRQISGAWSLGHDDGHTEGELITAEWGAAARLQAATDLLHRSDRMRRKHLIQAAALIVAEIERMDRAAEAPRGAAEEREPYGYTYGHCVEMSKPGGCTLHNLHCGFPDCDRKLTTLGGTDGR